MACNNIKYLTIAYDVKRKKYAKRLKIPPHRADIHRFIRPYLVIAIVLYNAVIVANFFSHPRRRRHHHHHPSILCMYQCIHKSSLLSTLSPSTNERITAEYTRDEAHFICTTSSHRIVWHSSH